MTCTQYLPDCFCWSTSRQALDLYIMYNYLYNFVEGYYFIIEMCHYKPDTFQLIKQLEVSTKGESTIKSRLRVDWLAGQRSHCMHAFGG